MSIQKLKTEYFFWDASCCLRDFSAKACKHFLERESERWKVERRHNSDGSWSERSRMEGMAKSTLYTDNVGATAAVAVGRAAMIVSAKY